MLMAAVNPNPRVDQFMKQFMLPFQVGTADYEQVRSFMELSVMMRKGVPWYTIIDKQGMIEGQWFGEDNFFLNEETNARTELLKWAAKPAPAAASKGGAAKKGKGK